MFPLILRKGEDACPNPVSKDNHVPTDPKKAEDRPEGDRIAKLLARAGVASRREVERMIAEGRVTLHGKPVETPATFLTSLRGVSVDGKPVGPPEPAQLWAFHKPTGLITAERDPAGRATIYAALTNALPKDTPRLMPIGRLDLNTEGLLLLTNDGGLKRQMELPASQVPRTYRARAFGEVSQEQLEALSEGVEVDGMRYGPIDANLEHGSGGAGTKNHWIEITITEGKNREVRRVLEHLGLQVSRLIRTAYGPFALGDLPRGQAARIRKGDLDRFRSSLKSSTRATSKTVEAGIGGGGGRNTADRGSSSPPRRPSPSPKPPASRRTRSSARRSS